MITLLLIGLIGGGFCSSSAPADSTVGHWTVVDDAVKTCIRMDAQLDLTLSYIMEDDSLAEAGMFTVPADSTTLRSSCSQEVQIGDLFIDSQVLQLDFPHNEGWNVRLAFTQDKRLGVDDGDYALFQVNVTANYTSMPDVFTNVAKDHIHTYFSVIDFNNPPDIANDEYTKVGDSIYCPSPQGYIINSDNHNGPPAVIRFSQLQMQAYMSTDDFGKKVTCADDETEIDLVPVIVSGVLAALVLFTLIAYFVYRSRLPNDILDMTQPEFEEEDDHHKHKDEHASLNHHDNYGYKEDSRF